MKLATWVQQNIFVCHYVGSLFAYLFISISSAWGRSTPSPSFLPLVHSLPHLLLFLTFSLFLFSFALLIFFFVHLFPFYQNNPHSISRPEVVGGDRTWV